MPKVQVGDVHGLYEAIKEDLANRYGPRDETHLIPYHITQAEQARIDEATERAHDAGRVDHAANERIVK